MNVPLPRAEQLRLREHQIFFVLSVLVGILAGLAAVLFSVAIEGTTHWLFGLAPSPLRLLVMPGLVSLGTGILLATIFPGVRGSGVPQTKAAYHLSNGRIDARVPVGKFITGVLCIGAGHSMGREGPSVQIGAGLASVVGRWMRLSDGRVRDLVPVGVAGALSAAFNTPVAAVLFTLEEIIGDMNAALLGSTVVASVAAVIVQRSILGNEPLFHVPPYHLVHPAELAAYAALGVAGGLVSLLFCKGLLATRSAVLRLPARTRIVQPAIGGVAVGALLVFWPAVMSVGYEYVDQALNGGLVFQTMAALCLVKIVATIVSYASGNAGGIFAPSLYIGAMAGGAIGVLVQQVAPFPTGAPGAYALVGMGTLFAGIIRAPMTSVFMIFEITQDYQILVPLMVANMLSFMISKRYQPIPVYHALLHQDGVHLPATGATPAGVATAGDVMDRGFALIPPEERVATVANAAGGAAMYLVGQRGRLIGAVTPDRLAEALNAGQGDLPVADVADRSLDHVHPDHSIDIVLQRLARGPGILPVVSRSDVGQLLGVVNVESVVAFVRRASQQRSAAVPEVQTPG